MNKLKQGRILVLPFLYLVLLFCTVSCKKNTDSIGLDILPASDNLPLFYTDTCQIVAYTVREDSLMPTDETSLSLLGSYFDPVFGSTAASFNAQLLLSSSSVNFGNNPIADSIVLSLAYEGFYGNINTLQTVRVYELSNSIYIDSTYYANQLSSYYPTELGSYTFVPKPTDSVYVGTVKSPPQLRIPLNISFANRLLAESGGSSLSNNTNFLHFFKGIHVKTDLVGAGGSILYFNLMNYNSKITLYYKNADTAKTFSFIFNEYCARYNQFNHFNYSNAAQHLKNQIFGIDTLLGNQKLYIQSMAGVKAKLQFPQIKKYLGNNKICIHQAKLVITINDEDGGLSTYPASPKLTITRNNGSGGFEFLLDQYEGASYFGGVYDNNKKQYSFNITRYLQALLDNKVNDYGINLVVSGSAVRASRLVVNGPKATQSPLRIELTYTKI